VQTSGPKHGVQTVGARCWLLIALRKNALAAATSRLALTLKERNILPDRPVFFITAGRRGGRGV
jgi:hypothetical protein